MRKYIILFTLLVVGEASSSQQIKGTDLHKYSFYIVTVTGTTLNGATGFIVKAQNRFFLVTNLHVMCKCKIQQFDKELQSRNKRPDSIKIMIPDFTTLRIKDLTFPLYGKDKRTYNYGTIELNHDLMVDAAALELPNFKTEYYISFDNFDLSKSLPPGKQITGVGFPEGGVFLNKGYAQVYSLSTLRANPFEIEYSGKMSFGNSGSPLYNIDERTAGYKLIGLHQSGLGIVLHGAYSYLVKQLIEGMLNQKKVGQ